MALNTGMDLQSILPPIVRQAISFRAMMLAQQRSSGEITDAEAEYELDTLAYQVMEAALFLNEVKLILGSP